MMTQTHKHRGGCACGAIRFEITQPFLGIGSCHCTDCQKASGGGPNYVALAPKESLLVSHGTPKIFYKSGDSGAKVGRAFCGDCGTPLWSIPVHEPFIPIKVGALDDPSGIAPQMQVYTSSAPSWHQIDTSIPAFEKMPPQPG